VAAVVHHVQVEQFDLFGVIDGTAISVAYAA